MAGTSPYTFTALELVTAAMMNAIQGNMQVVLDAINEPAVFSIPLNTDTALTTGDDKLQFHIPAKMNGWTITGATISRGSGSGTITVMLYNVTDSVDVFSSGLTIASGNYSDTVTINTSNDDVATGDRLRVDVDSAGTSSLRVAINLLVDRP